jgi:hypothetical protein
MFITTRATISEQRRLVCNDCHFSRCVY